MVVGLPNVGKSSIINAIKSKSKAAKGGRAAVGGNPGTTRGQSHFQVWDDPLTVLIDTPGVMMPRIDDNIDGLKLAILGIVKDGIVPPMLMASFLLHTLNTFESDRYKDQWKLEETTTDADVLMQQIMDYSGAQNQEAAAKKFMAKFRNGDLGHFVLDAPP